MPIAEEERTPSLWGNAGVTLHGDGIAVDHPRPFHAGANS
ncbi:hypothetical protein X742_29560 [Mesorhizobium sp. LNHC232B00]|nr:hypothetical protein X742_29560 [Mesorhizobium sp. LNHC232B00]